MVNSPIPPQHKISLRILRLILFISLSMIPLISSCQIVSLPSPTPSSFAYQVRVTTNTGEALPNVQVIIDIGGRSPLDGYTDTIGIARIFIEQSYVGQAGVLRIDADGYHPYRQNIDLVRDALPDEIRLNIIE